MGSWIAKVESVLRWPGFTDAALLLICALIVAAAALMHPSTEVLTLFGRPVPVMCTWRWLTGWSCPGCGLTRSFVFLAHGQLLAAFQMNPLGPVAFAWVVAQVPWRSWRLWQRTRAS